MFDDNIFGSSGRRESDFVSRLSSAVKVGYRSIPLTFLATSAFDAEVFAKHPDNDGLDRVQSGVEAYWRPTRVSEWLNRYPPTALDGPLRDLHRSPGEVSDPVGRLTTPGGVVSGRSGMARAQPRW